MTFSICIGRWGGFYCNNGRLCLGWIAFTYHSYEIDDLIAALVYLCNKYKIEESLEELKDKYIANYWRHSGL